MLEVDVARVVHDSLDTEEVDSGYWYMTDVEQLHCHKTRLRTSTEHHLSQSFGVLPCDESDKCDFFHASVVAIRVCRNQLP